MIFHYGPPIASIDLALDSYIYCTIIDISNIAQAKTKIKSNLMILLINYITIIIYMWQNLTQFADFRLQLL